jgi:hypothetical protein
VLDPARRRMLAPGIAEQWDRFGPPRPLRWLLRRWLHFDYDTELAYALAHAEDLPMVELASSGRSGANRSAGRTVRERRT